MRILSLVIILVLAGCTSAEEERKAAMEAYQARQAHYHQKCLEYGFSHGTPEYAQCRQRFDAMDRQEEAMKRGVVLQHLLAR